MLCRYVKNRIELIEESEFVEYYKDLQYRERRWREWEGEGEGERERDFFSILTLCFFLSVVLSLSCIRKGRLRHRALLFKFLCDQFGLPCRLIGAGSQIWNIAHDLFDLYLVDMRDHRAEEEGEGEGGDRDCLLPSSSPQAEEYRAIEKHSLLSSVRH